MKVSSIIRDKKVETIHPSASLKELIQKLTKFKIGALVVSKDEKTIEGIVSERDIVNELSMNFDSLSNLSVKDIMTSKVFTCKEDTNLSDLMILMTEKRIRHIPVIDQGGNLISIISIGDVVKNHVSEIDTERIALIDYIKSS